MTTKVTQEIVDMGYNDIMGEIKKMKNSYIKAGLPEKASPKLGGKSGSGHAPVSNMSELATIGAVHEFGAPKRNIPQRSFIKATTDKEKAAIIKVQEREIRAITGGASTVEMALKRMGLWMVTRIQRQIHTGPYKSLSVKTKKRKRSSVPLIDIGQMVGSIQYTLHLGGK